MSLLRELQISQKKKGELDYARHGNGLFNDLGYRNDSPGSILSFQEKIFNRNHSESKFLYCEQNEYVHGRHFHNHERELALFG